VLKLFVIAAVPLQNLLQDLCYY